MSEKVTSTVVLAAVFIVCINGLICYLAIEEQDERIAVLRAELDGLKVAVKPKEKESSDT